ncbi:hypothetical protein [Kitasatospora sp. NPDC004289]
MLADRQGAYAVRLDTALLRRTLRDTAWSRSSAARTGAAAAFTELRGLLVAVDRSAVT